MKTIKCFYTILSILLIACCYNTGIAQTEEEINRLLVRAKTAYSMGNYEDALREFQKVQELLPEYPDVYKAIADVYEKLGSEMDIKNAIKYYTDYLNLLPDTSDDRKAIQERIAMLEYKHEKIAEKNVILDDLSGIWITNLRMKKENDTDSIPLLMFQVVEIGKEGKFRIEILPESGLYSESIIDKIVNVVPDNQHRVQFTFADEKSYTPDQSKYDAMRSGLSTMPSNNSVGQLIAGVADGVISAVQASDLPKNTQAAYHFNVKYENGELKGYMNILRSFSTTQTVKNDDELYEIILKKDDIYYAGLVESLRLMTYRSGGAARSVVTGKRLSLNQIASNFNAVDPKLLKRYDNSYSLALGGTFIAYGAIGIVGGALALMGTFGGSDEKEVGQYLIIGGAVFTTGGILLVRSGVKRRKKAIDQSNEFWRQQKNRVTDLKLGTTPSGGLGLTLNF